MEIKDTLRQVLFLKTVSDEALCALTAAGQRLCLEKGELLFAELGRCRGLYVVLAGAIKITKTDSRGRELTLSLQGPGTSAGELPLFDGGNYPYSAEAAQAGTEVWFVPRDAFRELMHAHPEIAERGLLALSANRVTN